MSFSDAESSIRDGRHPTGVKVLDTDVLRGIPHGSTIAVIGRADAGTELLLHSLAATGRKTEYISTLRSDYGLIDDIKSVREDNVSEEEIENNVTIRTIDGDSPGDIFRKSLSMVNEGGNLIVDTFSKYQTDPGKMLDYAHKIHTKTRMNGGITYLYFASEYEDLTRIEKEILQLVDGVFNVETELTNEAVENNLYINKLRGMKLPKDGQQLVYGEKLTIDVTSDIG